MVAESARSPTGDKLARFPLHNYGRCAFAGFLLLPDLFVDRRQVLRIDQAVFRRMFRGCVTVIGKDEYAARLPDPVPSARMSAARDSAGVTLRM